MSQVVSIIVPVYNSGRTIRRCVDSILAQSFTDFEILLIDDGSTDESGMICDEYAAKDNRIKVIHKNNGGVSSARNAGLKMAAGDYIMFADSDDEVLPDWIASLIESAKLNDKETLIVGGVEFYRGEELSGVFSQNITFPVESLFNYSGLWGGCWNKIFESSIIKKYEIEFDEKLHYCEDCLFVATYVRNLSRVKVVDFVGYRYYCPASYGVKYEDSLSMNYILDYCSKLKKANPVCHRVVFDGLFMQFLAKYKRLPNKDKTAIIKETSVIFGSDIKYVKGKRKLLVRLLSYTNNHIIWKVVMDLSKNFCLC